MAAKNKSPEGFMNFIRTQGVIGLAVGLAIGTQVGKTVESLVVGFINPIVNFILGGSTNLLTAQWTIISDWNGRSLVFSWGLILTSLITLLAVAGVIYYVVHGLRLDKLDKKDE
jgi:large conductance mechanosensitive channel